MPIVTTMGLSGSLMRLYVGLCLVAAVMPNATRRTWHVLLAVVSLIALAQVAPITTRFGGAVFVLALTALVLLMTATGALRYAVTRREVDRETIYAALSTYLLAGIAFGEIYWMVETIQPQSFTGPDPFSEYNAIYYSFVTLATLGYGDFLPRTVVSRGIATFEVIGGQLFLAVLVARLIGVVGSKER